MKKFLVVILIISCMSILYVYQQAKLLEYGYDINSCQKFLSLLVDQNRQLRYNVAKLEAPFRLEELMLAKEDSEIYMPQVWHNIEFEQEFSNPLERAATSSSVGNMGRFILSMFSLDREAVAKELNE